MPKADRWRAVGNTLIYRTNFVAAPLALAFRIAVGVIFAFCNSMRLYLFGTKLNFLQ
jgi:hypothetical protein